MSRQSGNKQSPNSIRCFVLGCIVVATSAFGTARIASAEAPIKVMTDEWGRTWILDLDSRDFYLNNQGVKQVDFYLSTANDGTWHSATASCNPYDLSSPSYGFSFEDGSVSYPAGTVAGNISRVACRW